LASLTLASSWMNRDVSGYSGPRKIVLITEDFISICQYQKMMCYCYNPQTSMYTVILYFITYVNLMKTLVITIRVPIITLKMHKFFRKKGD
jgi:hypothetical protein